MGDEAEELEFTDENPQFSRVEVTESPVRVQPHLNTIAREAPNPLASRRESNLSESSKTKFPEIVRDSVKKVSLQEYQHDTTQMTMFNIVPSPRDDRDWNGEAIYDTTKPLPVTLDLRKHMNVPKNQGYQGTCAAHVAACMKEYQEYKNIEFTGYMSSQFIYNNRQNQLSTAMYGRDVMNILKNIGCCSENVYPYEKIEHKSEIDKRYLFEASLFKIKHYARISTIDTLKRALFINGPCYISFPVYNHTLCMWKQYKGEKKIGGHAMTVVGYDIKGFILRNSWGPYWQDEGYCIYPYSDWGSHYEIWTIIDENSFNPPPKRRYIVEFVKYLFSKKKENPTSVQTKNVLENGFANEIDEVYEVDKSVQKTDA
jgi:hypothetical protein